MSNTTGAIQEHLRLNAGVIETYPKAREIIINYAKAKQKIYADPSPIDISKLQKGRGKPYKGKGKGKHSTWHKNYSDQNFNQSYSQNYDQHEPQKGKGKGKSKGKGKGKGAGKGKGKGAGKGKGKDPLNWSYKNNYGVCAVNGEWNETGYQESYWNEAYETDCDSQWYNNYDSPWYSYSQESESWPMPTTLQNSCVTETPASSSTTPVTVSTLTATEGVRRYTLGHVHYSTINSLKSSDYMMFDTGAGVHVCPLWFCEDYPIYKPQYPILLNGASGNPITVYGLRTVHLQLTADEKSCVYVQFVAADVTEPILSYQVLKANKNHGEFITSRVRLFTKRTQDTA
jgi:hypothetical protein